MAEEPSCGRASCPSSSRPAHLDLKWLRALDPRTVRIVIHALLVHTLSLQSCQIARHVRLESMPSMWAPRHARCVPRARTKSTRRIVIHALLVHTLSLQSCQIARHVRLESMPSMWAPRHARCVPRARTKSTRRLQSVCVVQITQDRLSTAHAQYARVYPASSMTEWPRAKHVLQASISTQRVVVGPLQIHSFVRRHAQRTSPHGDVLLSSLLSSALHWCRMARWFLLQIARTM